MRSVPLLSFLSLFVPCARAQWSVPVPVANVNTAMSEFDPSVTFDGLTMYLSRQTPNFEIFRAVRTAPYGTFGAATLVAELADPGTDAGPFARIDDREIFFYSSRAGGSGGADIWRAERASTSVPFNAPVPVTEINSSSSEGGMSLTADGLRIYFGSSRPGGMGLGDIWTATRPSFASPFTTPTLVVELSSVSDDREPHISPDGLTLFFTSTRAGGLGGNDTWMATRLDTASPFGSPVNVAALNNLAADASPSFSIFHDEIFFTSFRLGGPGSYDIHSSRFTGVVASGIASGSSAQSLRFSDPASAGLVYVAASSLGTSPGIPIDTRVLPLNLDLLLQLSIGGIPPILTGYVGVLDPDGVGGGQISFVGFPGFVGLRFYTAFLVIDASSPSGIKTISNAHEVKVQ